MNNQIIKYPRTPHIEGSRLQKGDEDLKQIPFSTIKGKYIVVEEKIDGANSAISFNDNGQLLLQSRGHYLTGGYRERHYNLFKQWASIHQNVLYNILGTQYIMYGEWMYAKHTIYYDNLPHYFFEFDIYDKINKKYLDTETRHKMLKGSPIISVPVLSKGCFNKMEDVLKYLGDSNYITKDHKNNLDIEVEKNNLRKEDTIYNDSTLMEGLYIKVEENGKVIDRMKYVRYSFYQSVQESDSHWLDRPIIPNKLNRDINELFK